MGYSIEFINNLPKTMQTEILNLSSQIDALEAQKATLQLPVDVIASYELVKANTDEAAKIIAEARKTASDIVETGKASAEALYNSAKTRADADLTSAANTVENANKTKADANTLLANTQAAKNKVKDNVNQLNLDRARFEAEVTGFKTVVSELIAHLSGI